jgi:hypothetical protein
MSRRLQDVQEWLRGKPSLAEVRRDYPAEWEQVRREVAVLQGSQDPQRLKDHLAALVRTPVETPGRRRPEREVISAQVHRYLAVALLDQAYLSATTGVMSGKIRLGLVGGFLAQRLLFVRELERRPVSLFWFRVVWPLVRSRRTLMPLVRQKGIYCFYSRALIRRLADLIGDRSCLEIAAGDGTLTAFLRAAGVQITATDDHSWGDAVHYPEDVVRLDARKALRSYQPQVVICSWPPPANVFERQVFTTASVELYLVITTRHELGAGDWDVYRAQQDFELVDDPRLARLTLPPELDGAVLVFRRRPRDVHRPDDRAGRPRTAREQPARE